MKRIYGRNGSVIANAHENTAYKDKDTELLKKTTVQIMQAKIKNWTLDQS